MRDEPSQGPSGIPVYPVRPKIQSLAGCCGARQSPFLRPAATKSFRLPHSGEGFDNPKDKGREKPHPSCIAVACIDREQLCVPARVSRSMLLRQSLLAWASAELSILSDGRRFFL
jgi:hypothetical protein